MNSKQNKSVTPKRNTPLKRRSVSGKENDGMVICKISSGRKVEQMINDMRISACKTITNVKSSFGDMSHVVKSPLCNNAKCGTNWVKFGKEDDGDVSADSKRLRRSSLRTRSFPKAQHYEELGEQVTPVKLYSPFTFVTPSPDKSSCKKSLPKRFTFASPTGKFQKDVQQLTKEVKELERTEKKCLRKFR